MSHRRLSARWVEILTAAVVVAVTACSNQSANSTGVVAQGGTIVIRTISDWLTFDPAGLAGNSNRYTLMGPYATLLALDTSGKLIPYLAKSWTASPTSVTFKLRTDATCSDGTRVTPTVVMNSLQRLIKVGSLLLSQDWGPGPYSVTADEAAGTVTFTVGTPNSELVYGFVDDFPGYASAIVCPAGLANPQAMATQAFGAGPYTVEEAVHNDHVTMKLRSGFNWGPFNITAKTPGVPQTVIYKIVPNDTTAANLLLTGGLDLGAVFGPDAGRLLSDTSLAHRSVPTYAMGSYIFNQLPNHVTADIKVRQALITAIDPKAVMQAATAGGVPGQLSSSMFNPHANCYDAATARMAPTPSVANARSILESDGWSMQNGKLMKNGQVLTINFIGDMVLGAGNEYVLNQWTQMGANVLYNITDVTHWGPRLIAGDFEASMIDPGMGFDSAVGRWIARYAGPFPPTGGNWLRMNDPVFNQEVAAARATIGAASCTHWAAVQEELWKQWALLPLFSSNLEYFSKNFDMSKMVGDTFPPIDLLRLK